MEVAMDWIKDVRKKLKCEILTLDEVSQDDRGYLPTGVLPLDYVTGVQGFPLGRVVEIFGLESVGKSAIVAALLGSAHVLGGTAVLADTEQAYTNDWARLFSISPEDLLILNPDHLQEATESFKYLADFFELHKLPEPRVIAWDSIAATPALEEVDDDLSDKAVGLHARALSKGLRKLTSKVEDSNTLFVCTNQQKEKVGIWGSGGPTKIGGHALDFHCCLQLQLKKTGLINDPQKKHSILGMNLVITAVKNKIYRPYITSTVKYYFNSGFDDSEFIIWFAAESGILEVSGGGWKRFEDEKFQGVPSPEIYSLIESKVIDLYYGPYAGQVKQIRELRSSNVFLHPKWGRVESENSDSDESGESPEVSGREVTEETETLGDKS